MIGNNTVEGEAHRKDFTLLSLLSFSFSDLAPENNFLSLSSSPSIRKIFFDTPQC